MNISNLLLICNCLFGLAEENFVEEKILQFAEYNKFPLVTVLTELNSARVYFSPIKLQVLLIYLFLVIFETCHFSN